MPLSPYNEGRSLQTQLRPADILLPAWQHGRSLAVDVTVTHPAKKSELPFTVDRTATFLKRKEAEKLTKYKSPCEREGWDFLPLAFDTWGTLGSRHRE